MRHLFFPALILLATGTLATAPANAQTATGLWLRENGASHVRIAPCGEALCGFIAWVREPDRAKDVGLKVFYDMKPSGPNAWTGQAFNPEDGKTYSGRMVLEGNGLKTSGCVFGGLICKSVNWTRLK